MATRLLASSPRAAAARSRIQGCGATPRRKAGRAHGEYLALLEARLEKGLLADGDLMLAADLYKIHDS